VVSAFSFQGNPVVVIEISLAKPKASDSALSASSEAWSVFAGAILAGSRGTSSALAVDREMTGRNAGTDGKFPNFVSLRKLRTEGTINAAAEPTNQMDLALVATWQRR
jgi:hypothetical protein